MAAIAFEISHPEIVAQELAQANRRLAKEQTTPPSILALVSELCEQIGETSRDDWATVMADQWIELQQTAMRAQRVVLAEEDERSQRRQLRLLIEELRFRLVRLAEHEAFDAQRPIDDVLRWFDRAISVPQTAKAELLGVHDRTYQRWISETDTSRPGADDDERVRLVARVVNDLRTVLSASGVIAWMRKPHPALSNRSPLAVIEDAEADELQNLYGLIAAARAGAAA